MPLDPQAKTFLDLLNQVSGPTIDELGAQQARKLYSGMTAAADGEVASVDDRAIPGPAGDLPVRIYTPVGEGPLPLHVTFHGGGFVLGDLDTHHAVAQSICVLAGAVVVSVDYRLAPEHPYPAAADDCYAATVWAVDHASEMGADPAALSVGGDSAGGNLAAVVSTMARDRGGPAITLQVLVYPVIAHGGTYASRADNAEGYYLTTRTMDWFTECYLQGQPLHSYNAPIVTPDCRGLPPALVITAEFDPLRDEGEAYARMLEEAGVPVTTTRYEGQIHGFLSMPQMIDRARDAHQQIADAIKAATPDRAEQASGGQPEWPLPPAGRHPRLAQTAA